MSENIIKCPYPTDIISSLEIIYNNGQGKVNLKESFSKKIICLLFMKIK